MSEFAERLKQLRGTSSQAEMARQLDMPQPQWARYESGRSTPSIELLAKICRAHAVSADWLLGLPTARQEQPPNAARDSALAEFAKHADALNDLAKLAATVRNRLKAVSP